MTLRLKALIVSPYLDHLGGGERYMLSAASALEKAGYSIYFAWDNLAEINSLATMLGITLTKPQLAPVIKNLYQSRNPLSMYRATKEFDVILYLSDGSIPILGGRKNLVHMQVPFHNVGGRSLKNQIKKLFTDQVIVNSAFTKRIVDREYGINSVVVYPPVKIEETSLVKENIILSVGRFEPSLNAKKQDILIQAFAQLSPQIPSWKLVLAGASASEEWVSQLQMKAADLQIEFAVNASYQDLVNLYSKARIYWHAAGFGVDENKNPELVEHFGITTAEAIGYGCIPLVVPYGGQREIVQDQSMHWENIEQLVSNTLSIIKVESDNLLANISIERYNEVTFNDKIIELVS